MNLTELHSDIGLLRREQRDTRAIASNIDVKLRQMFERPWPPSPVQILARSLACHVLGARHSQPAAAVAAQHYHNDPEVLRALAAPGSIAKAAHAPATMTQSGWAAELAATTNADITSFLQLLAPASIYSQLSRFPAALRIGLAGEARKIPARASGSLAPAFVAEGAPIPVKQITLSSATVDPHKAVVLSAFTREMLKGSVPSIEAVIRITVELDAVGAIDGVLLGSAAGSAVQPPGLLNGVTPTAATAGGGLAAFAGDVRALAAAIEATGSLIAPVLIMSSTSALYLRILSQGGSVDMPILSAPSVPQKRLIMVDAAFFASGEGDAPVVQASNEALVHEDDTPAPIGTPGGLPPPNVVAAPVRSYWQTDVVGLKFLQDVGWVMSRSGRVAYVDTVSW